MKKEVCQMCYKKDGQWWSVADEALWDFHKTVACHRFGVITQLPPECLFAVEHNVLTDEDAKTLPGERINLRDYMIPEIERTPEEQGTIPVLERIVGDWTAGPEVGQEQREQKPPKTTSKRKPAQKPKKKTTTKAKKANTKIKKCSSSKSKKQNEEQKKMIINISSLKGGVGKTTYGLKLAEKFLDEGWAVLFLDADITGTSVLNSGWVSGSKYNVVQHKGKPANFLSMYNDSMCGLALNGFRGSKSYDFDKINVIDSSWISGLDLEPSVIFDELHGGWWVEFIQMIREDFEYSTPNPSNKNTVMIIDHSTGYLGLVPLVQEWLADVGAEIGKFIMISPDSPYEFDNAVRGMGRIIKQHKCRVKVANYLSNDPDDSIDLDDDEEPFFMRMCDGGNSKSNRRGEKDYCDGIINLDFYDEKNIEQVNYYDQNPSKYAQIIVRCSGGIRMLPRSDDYGMFVYDNDSFSDAIEHVYQEFTQ